MVLRHSLGSSFFFFDSPEAFTTSTLVLHHFFDFKSPKASPTSPDIDELDYISLFYFSNTFWRVVDNFGFFLYVWSNRWRYLFSFFINLHFWRVFFYIMTSRLFTTLWIIMKRLKLNWFFPLIGKTFILFEF